MSKTNSTNKISRRVFLQSCGSTLLTALSLTSLPIRVAADEPVQSQAVGYGEGLYSGGSYPAIETNSVFIPIITKE